MEIWAPSCQCFYPVPPDDGENAEHAGQNGQRHRGPGEPDPITPHMPPNLTSVASWRLWIGYPSMTAISSSRWGAQKSGAYGGLKPGQTAQVDTVHLPDSGDDHEHPETMAAPDHGAGCVQVDDGL